MDQQPTLDRVSDTKNAKIMLAIFGVLTLLFVCGGAVVVGLAGSQRETDGMNAAMALTGPACCALGGLLTSMLAMVALPTKKTAQLIAPVAVGVLAGLFGGAGIFVFFAAIWPSL